MQQIKKGGGRSFGGEFLSYMFGRRHITSSVSRPLWPGRFTHLAQEDVNVIPQRSLCHDIAIAAVVALRQERWEQG